MDQKESLQVLVVETPNHLKFKVLLIRATEGCCVHGRVIRGNSSSAWTYLENWSLLEVQGVNTLFVGSEKSRLY